MKATSLTERVEQFKAKERKKQQVILVKEEKKSSEIQ